MKLKHIWIYAIGFVTITSCADFDALEYHVDKPESVAMQEEINTYDDLLNYVNLDRTPGFKLGAAITHAQYMGRGVLYRLINRNFNEVSLEAAMTHGAVVQSNGDLNVVSLTDFLSTAKEHGLSPFGHPLVWHSNQNSSYLNGLIAPLIVNSPPFANSLNKSGLMDGSFQGWNRTNGNTAISVVNNEGMGGNSRAIQLRSGVNSMAPSDLQLVSPAIPVLPGKDYEVIIYIKSDGPGEGRISFEGLADNTPQRDWMNTGEITETFNTNLSWREIRFIVRDVEGDSFKIKFDLGYEPNVTYHIDLENLYVYDTQGDPIINNLIANGDFENGIAWGGWGNNSTRGVTPVGQGVNNSGRALWVTNPSLTGGFWEVQTTYPFAEPLKQGETYKLSFWVKGTTAGVIRPELQSPNFSSNGFGMVYVTEEWQHVTLNTTATTADRSRLIISYGEFAGTVYLDEFVLSSSAVQGGTTTIVPKSPAEKNQIIGAALTNWVSKMVDAASPYVTSWNVVNQPMDDNNPFQLRNGNSGAGTGQFYWQDHLGKNYGVMAFQLAREHGNSGDLLYISDNNLHNNLDKCRGLIDYVHYIENNGAVVDGIAPQMSLNLSTDVNQVGEMFKLLAATSKMIKITNLNIAMGTGQPSTVMFQQQADMYQDVLEMYRTHVPAQQRGGISLGGITDGADYGLLWSPNLNRKPAYAGFAEGLKE